MDNVDIMNKKWLLVTILIASLGLNLILLTLPKSPTDTPVGTYIGKDNSRKVVITIEADGKYCIYEPNKSIIKRGKYTIDDKTLFLDNSDKDLMYFDKELLIYNLNGDSLVEFRKENEMPTYIGIDESKLN